MTVDQDFLTVSFVDCNCPWRTKLCEEHHTKRARIPIEIVKQYELKEPE